MTGAEAIMACAGPSTVSMPIVQVLLIAGAIIGTAIIASWRETVGVARNLTAANVEIAELRRRIGALETLTRKD